MIHRILPFDFRWVKEGYEVVFCDITDGTEVAQESKSTFIKCDVTDAKQVEDMIEQIKTKFGRLDVLFNNAGIANLQDSVTTETLSNTVNFKSNLSKYQFLFARHRFSDVI